jgi:predicted PurR-regulated permease PerM
MMTGRGAAVPGLEENRKSRDTEALTRDDGSRRRGGPRPRQQGGGSRRKVPLRLVTLAVLTAILLALSLLIAFPFLHAITWGMALAIMAWPMHRRVKARIASPSGAAFASTFVVLLLIVVPGVFVVYQIGRETEQMARESETPPDQMVSRETLEEVPGGSRVVTWMDRVNIDVEKQLGDAVSTVLPNPKSLAAGSITAAAQFLIAMFILFYVFRDRGEFMQWLRELLPLTRSEGDRVFSSAADSVHANLYATVVTGLIDSSTFTLLFWFIGMPAPFLWGSVMLVLSILPVVGAGMIWFPTSVYLAMTGEWPSAMAILAWGAFTGVAVDYLLYARLAGNRMRMHPVPALLSFLGGLAIFGLSGVILGPAIVAMTSSMLDLWRERSTPKGSAMSEAG